LERADLRFVWNESLLSPIVNACGGQAQVHPFLVPLIHGAVFVNKCQIGGKAFTWTLIR